MCVSAARATEPPIAGPVSASGVQPCRQGLEVERAVLEARQHLDHGDRRARRSGAVPGSGCRRPAGRPGADHPDRCHPRGSSPTPPWSRPGCRSRPRPPRRPRIAGAGPRASNGGEARGHGHGRLVAALRRLEPEVVDLGLEGGLGRKGGPGIVQMAHGATAGRGGPLSGDVDGAGHRARIVTGHPSPGPGGPAAPPTGRVGPWTCTPSRFGRATWIPTRWSSSADGSTTPPVSWRPPRPWPWPRSATTVSRRCVWCC